MVFYHHLPHSSYDQPSLLWMSWMLEGYLEKMDWASLPVGSPAYPASIIPAADAKWLRCLVQPKLGVCHFLGAIDQGEKGGLLAPQPNLPRRSVPGLYAPFWAVPAFWALWGPCPLGQRVQKTFRVLHDLHTHVLYWRVYTTA